MSAPPDTITGATGAPWDPALDHRFVAEDGTALCLRTDGDPDAVDTVLLVHGWTQDHSCWDAVVGELLRRHPSGVRILRYDHRGHGGSAAAPAGTATVEQVADDLAALITERVPHGRLVLGGHSMGGATIMALAQRHPYLLSRIVGVGFVGTTSGGLSELTFGLPRRLAKRIYRGEAVASKYLARSNRDAFARHPAALRPVVRRLTFGKHADRADVIATAEQIGRARPANMLSFLDSLLEHDRIAELPAFADIPCFVAHGGRDRLIPPAHGRVIAESLPDANLMRFPDAGHMLTAERPFEVARGLAAMIRRS